MKSTTKIIMKSFLFVAFCAAITLEALAIPFASQSHQENNSDIPIPYQVSLRHANYNIHLCSGAILTKYWILTTARCVSKFNETELEAFYGNHKSTGSSKSVFVEKIFVHHEYSDEFFKNDIAMLLLTNAIRIVPNVVQPLKLPKQAPMDDDEVTVSGWIWKPVIKKK